jgi:hypothetical protein
MNELIKKAINAKRESKAVEFKKALDVSSLADWCELIKDIIAIANSGGGVIFIGIDDNAKVSEFDVSTVVSIDSADITNKIYRYTGHQFSNFEVVEIEKDSMRIVAFVIYGVSVPIVFTKPGTYEIGERKQKTAFKEGAVYFRHGAKSEPGTSDDLRKVIDRQLAIAHKEWTRGLRKVVEAPRGAKIIVENNDTQPDLKKVSSVRIVDDPSAPAIRFTRDSALANGTYFHEELSDGLFSEINNVLNANDLLAAGRGKFLLGYSIYYRIYAERQHVKVDPKQFKLLAVTGIQDIYGPCLYWLLKLPVSHSASILRFMCENPKIPGVRTVIRAMILFGPEATEWLLELWNRKWPHQGQHYDYYYLLKKHVSEKKKVERKLLALKTISGSVIENLNEGQKYTLNDYIASPQLASTALSKACVRVFNDDKDARTLCRQLDILAYGEELEQKGEEIFSEMTRE